MASGTASGATEAVVVVASAVGPLGCGALEGATPQPMAVETASAPRIFLKASVELHNDESERHEVTRCISEFLWLESDSRADIEWPFRA